LGESQAFIFEVLAISICMLLSTGATKIIAEACSSDEKKSSSSLKTR